MSPDGGSCHEYRAAGDVTQSEDISRFDYRLIVPGQVHTLETRPFSSGVQRTLRHHLQPYSCMTHHQEHRHITIHTHAHALTYMYMHTCTVDWYMQCT